MTTNKNQTGILFIEKNRIDFFENSINAVVRLEFPATLVRDLEILDYAKMDEQINTFITTNKITPAHIIIVLSQNIFFEKDFSASSPEAETQELEAFLDYVPFESISYKKLQLAKGFKILAANSDFYEALMKAFVAQGSSIASILPAVVFAVNIQGLDSQTIKLIVDKSNNFKKYDMQILPETVKSADSKQKIAGSVQSDSSAQKNNKRVYILVGLFVVLIIALVGVIVVTSRANTTATSSSPATNPGSK